MALSVYATRSTASMSWAESLGDATTSRTPARSDCCSSWVEISSATRMLPSSGRVRLSCSMRARPWASAYVGPNTTTIGSPESKRSPRASIDENDADRALSPSCMARRVRSLGSSSTTATRKGVGLGSANATAGPP